MHIRHIRHIRLVIEDIWDLQVYFAIVQSCWSRLDRARRACSARWHQTWVALLMVIWHWIIPGRLLIFVLIDFKIWLFNEGDLKILFLWFLLLLGHFKNEAWDF